MSNLDDRELLIPDYAEDGSPLTEAEHRQLLQAIQTENIHGADAIVQFALERLAQLRAQRALQNQYRQAL